MRKLRIYSGVVVIMCLRLIRRALYRSGELLKKIARAMSNWGSVEKPRWGVEIFQRCYTANPDAEIHIGRRVYRGPLRSMHYDFWTGDRLSLNFNWLAERDILKLGNSWKYSGQFSFLVKGYSLPVEITDNGENKGDIWFSFEGGHAIIYLGEPRKRLEFAGEIDTPSTSVFTWDWKAGKDDT